MFVYGLGKDYAAACCHLQDAVKVHRKGVFPSPKARIFHPYMISGVRPVGPPGSRE